MRTFMLYREEDISGVSGEGYIAEGVEFSDGKVVLRWLGELRTTEIAHDIATIEAIHGHEGRTKVIWD